MKKVLMVEFEHEEKKPDGFNAALAEFLGHVLTVGYRVHGKWVHDHGQEVPKAGAPISTLSISVATPSRVEMVGLAVETATAVDGPDDMLGPLPPFIEAVTIPKSPETIAAQEKAKKAAKTKPKVKKAKK